MAKSEIQVGRSLREMASEAAEAWKTAEAGHTISSRAGTYFRDWSALNAVLTPKRYDLLRHLRREPTSGVRALARALDRDVKRVHEDVVALAEIGLVTRGEDGRLSTDVDEIEFTVHIST